MATQDIVEFLVNDFYTLKKFDDFLKALNYYHTERCERDDCSQSLFAVNLRYIYTEYVVQQKMT